MKIKTTIYALLIALISYSSFANGLSLNSVGPRALGMGGAFVGLADDATAIYWNPAGLANIKGAYVGLFATDVSPMPTYKNDALGIDAKGKVNHYISPNIIGYWDCMLYDKLKISLGTYVPAGLGSEWDGEELKKLSLNENKEWMSKIAVINFSPAISYKILPNFSIGVAGNIYYGMFDLKRPEKNIRPQTGNPIVGQYSESSTGFGYGATIGLLYSPIKELSIGTTFRTKTKVKMSGDASNTLLAAYNAEKSDFDRDVSWPLWLAGGIAYKPTEYLTFTFDVQYSQWSEACDEFVTKFDSPTWIAATSASEKNIFKLHWKDATQIRFGAEYKASETLTLRLGAYNDPAPAPDETYNILFPDITYKAITLGATYKLGNINFDLGMEYLFGKERVITQAVDPKFPTVPSNLGGIHNCDIIAISIGAGISF